MKISLLIMSASLDAARYPDADRRGCSASKGQELPHGAAMPLGKFQKGMRVCEGLQIASALDILT